MTTISADDFEIVCRTPLFAGLPRDALETLLRHSRVVEFPRGKVLFVRGEPAERFYLVLEGWVKVFRDNPDGEQTVIAVMKPGETIADCVAAWVSMSSADSHPAANRTSAETMAAPARN